MESTLTPSSLSDEKLLTRTFKKRKKLIVAVLLVLLFLAILSGRFWPYFSLYCSNHYIQEYFMNLDMPENSKIEEFISDYNWQKTDNMHEIDTVNIYALEKRYNYGPFKPVVYLGFHRPIIEDCREFSMSCFDTAKTEAAMLELADYTGRGSISLFIHGEHRNLPIPKFIYRYVYTDIISELNEGLGFEFNSDLRNNLNRSCD